MSWETNPLNCPICNSSEMVFPFGSRKSSILIVGDAPGSDELLSGRPFSGQTGYVLRTELGLVGLDVMQMRLTNLWLHPPTTSISKAKKVQAMDCLTHFMGEVVKEAKDKKAILLIGADPVKVFCGVSVKEYNGLVVVSQYFSAPCIISIQPTMVFKSTVGEVRFAIRQFATFVKENNI